jgi:hypothetical protein
MTAPAFIYTSEPWAALSFGRPIFAPAFKRKRMSAGHLPQSSASRFTAGALFGISRDLHGHRIASAEVWLTDGDVSTQLSLAIPRMVQASKPLTINEQSAMNAPTRLIAIVILL